VTEVSAEWEWGMANFVWQGGDGNFSDQNWSDGNPADGSGPPTTGQDATVSSPGNPDASPPTPTTVASSFVYVVGRMLHGDGHE